jgi:hypothetical protein
MFNTFWKNKKDRENHNLKIFLIIKLQKKEIKYLFMIQYIFNAGKLSKYYY